MSFLIDLNYISMAMPSIDLSNFKLLSFLLSFGFLLSSLLLITASTSMEDHTPELPTGSPINLAPLAILDRDKFLTWTLFKNTTGISGSTTQHTGVFRQ